MLVRAGLEPTDTDRLELGLNRSAHRVRLTLPNGATLVVAVTHLHHTVDGAAERDRQTAD